MFQREAHLFARKEWAILATRDANWHKKCTFFTEILPIFTNIWGGGGPPGVEQDTRSNFDKNGVGHLVLILVNFYFACLFIAEHLLDMQTSQKLLCSSTAPTVFPLWYN